MKYWYFLSGAILATALITWADSDAAYEQCQKHHSYEQCVYALR